MPNRNIYSFKETLASIRPNLKKNIDIFVCYFCGFSSDIAFGINTSDLWDVIRFVIIVIKNGK